MAVSNPPSSSRGRTLPLAPRADAGLRHLPLAPVARDVDRAHRPVLAVWELTLKCDLACRHCGSRAGRERPDELSTAESLDLVRQLAEMGVREVTLIGGEAYLRPDWVEIIRAIHAAGMDCTMTTGGRGLTAERVRAAAAAGIRSVSVSVDGGQDAHDHLRGLAGSHRAALDALGHLRAAGILSAANTQINRLSMPDLPDVLETIIDAGVSGWQVMLTVAMGRAADQPDLLLQPFELLQLFPMLARLKRRAREAGVPLWPGNNVGYFGPFEAELRAEMPRGHMSHCGAGCNTLGIEANGAIKGCPSLQSVPWTGGNIRDASLRDIWERSAPLRAMRDWTPDQLWGHCRGCYYASTCRAGCTWTAYSLFGRSGNNPLCHHRALELHRAGRRERLVRVEAAPGQPFDRAQFEIIEEDIPHDPIPALPPLPAPRERS